MAGRIPTSEIRKRMSEMLDMLSVPDRWIIITRHGDPVAAMVSIDLLWKLLEAGDGGAQRISYTVPGQAGDAIETASAKLPARKAERAPSEISRPIEVEIGPEAIPNLDELLRRIDRLRNDAPQMT